MRKLILIFALAMSMIGTTIRAQVTDKAIGLRFGYSGAEISYQQPLGTANRLELDLGINNWGLGLNGIYQWVWNLTSEVDGLKWYAGVGGNLGLHTYSNFGLGVVGQIGIEYNFDFPLQLSLDYRPGIYIIPTVYGIYDGVCLSARYRF